MDKIHYTGSFLLYGDFGNSRLGFKANVVIATVVTYQWQLREFRSFHRLKMTKQKTITALVSGIS